MKHKDQMIQLAVVAAAVFALWLMQSWRTGLVQPSLAYSEFSKLMRDDQVEAVEIRPDELLVTVKQAKGGAKKFLTSA